MNSIKRLFNLLKLDKKDIYQIWFYAAFSGVVSLSLPLGIQAIISFIQAGEVTTSWIVLIIIVSVGVLLGGFLSYMQLRITENVQQKIFIRSTFEFAFRIPNIKHEEIYKHYPPELANRFFDTLSIQKGLPKLLIDYTSAFLQILFGVVLLSLYHPFFLFFGLIILLFLFIILKFSFINGVITSLKESKYKYKVAHWLQDIARNYYVFKKPSYIDFALEKNNNFTQEYINNREKHFGIIKKQFVELVFFKFFITIFLLLIGGLLVINQKINVGQFVAAELVILLIINSIEKIILGLETLYDLVTSIEKIGQITDMQLENNTSNYTNQEYSNFTVNLDNVSYKYPDSSKYLFKNISLKIVEKEIILLNGDNGTGKSTLLKILSGLIKPTSGQLFINDNLFNVLNLPSYKNSISYIFENQTLFEGTIYENLCLGKNISLDLLKETIDVVGLSEFITQQPIGLQTLIHTEGKQVSSSNIQKILIARNILQKPKILYLEEPTHEIDAQTALKIISYLTLPKHKWSIFVVSKDPVWKKYTTKTLTLSNGKLLSDTNL